MSDVLVKRARALARSLSEDLRVVGLLARLPDDPGSLEAVVELASSLGRSRRTLLANLTGSSSGLDAYLEAGASRGLAAVLRGEGRLGEVAVRPGTRPFLYLPAGDVPSFRPWLRPGRETDREDGEDLDADEDGGAPLELLLERLTERIRRAEAVLLLYLPAELARTDAAAELLDGLVSLSGEAASEARDTGLPVVGVRGPEAPVPTPEASGTEDDVAEDDVGAAGGEAPAAAPAGPSGPGEERPRWELEDAEPEEEATVAADAAGASEAPESTSAGERWGEMARSEMTRDGEADVDEGHGEGGDGAPDSDGPEREGRWRRHRRSDSPPWGRIALGALAVLVLAVGWWALARSASNGDGGASSGGDVGAGTGREGGDPGARAAAVDSTAEAADSAPGAAMESVAVGAVAREPSGEAPVPADSVVRMAPELSHSVLVASYGSLAQARSRADAWSREDGLLYFVAPTRIDGDVYHRLFSGALASSEEGRRAMERLVELGRKDSARAWDVRPAGLAYRLAVTRDRAEAGELRDELVAGDVPAYVLIAVDRGDTVYQVYAGGYERAGQNALDETLRALGRDGALVTRRGAPQTP